MKKVVALHILFVFIVGALFLHAMQQERHRTALPATIKIGPINYEVKRISEPGLMGEILFDESEIRIRPNLPRDREAQVVLHEVFHGCAYAASRVVSLESDKQPLYTEDQMIEAISLTCLQVLRDNPALVAYLTE